MEILEKVEQLKAELDSLRPLDGEAEARIMQKFRLDWNYHSNNIEGNSLTYGETKALILFGITAQGKPLKDHFEITGHNEAINWVIDLVKGDTELTEKFIRELHVLLLKESSYKDAVTPEGKPTRRKIEVGKYKTNPNHVITVTGETFYFASPEETPAKMQELIEWFRNEKEKSDVNPVILASLFHYRFIRIHPFDDGNGRVARILMNFILMQFGYPPVIVKTEDKENYYAVLRLADAGELEPFIEYISTNLEHSLRLMVKGAKGEDIEEPDDLDKELTLLEGKFLNRGQKVIKINRESVRFVFEETIWPTVEKLLSQFKKFDKFYVAPRVHAKYSYIFFIGTQEITTGFIEVDSLNSLRKEVYERAGTEFRFVITKSYGQINRSEFTKHNYEAEIKVNLNDLEYEMAVQGKTSETVSPGIMISWLYSEVIAEPEIKKLLDFASKSHKKFLESIL